jgi:hypothetical protein
MFMRYPLGIVEHISVFGFIFVVTFTIQLFQKCSVLAIQPRFVIEILQPFVLCCRYRCMIHLRNHTVTIYNLIDLYIIRSSVTR